jgi:hypothetical protein
MDQQRVLKDPGTGKVVFVTAGYASEQLRRAEKAEARIRVLEGELRWALTAIRAMGGERTDGKEWPAFQRAEAALASEGIPEEAS